MKKKVGMKTLSKLLSGTLALSLCIGQTAFAGEVGMSGEGSATGTAPSEFSVADAESSAVVRLPANLDLDFSEELGAFQIESQVGVYGDIKDFAEISVSIDENLIYSDGVLNENLSSYSNTMATSEQVLTGHADKPYAIDVRLITMTTYSRFCVDYYHYEADVPIFLLKNGNASAGYVGNYYIGAYYNGNVIRFDNTDAAHTNQAQSIDLVGWHRSAHYDDSVVYQYDIKSEYQLGRTQGQAGVANTKFEGRDDEYAHTQSQALFDRFGVFSCSGLVFDSATVAQDYYSFDADDYNHVTGKVLFGENANGVCTETWNSEQAALGLTNHDVEGEDDTDYRTIMVNVPSYEVTTSGTYYATAEFEINFTCVGMNSDIGATTKLSGKEIEESDYSYAWDEDYTSTASMVNLGRMGNKPFVISTSALKDNTSMQSIEHVQLADNTTTSYLTYIDDTNPTLCNSWLMGMHGVQVLVIPENVTTEQLHRTAGNTRDIDGDTELTVSNSITAVFDETNTKIGNAMCFVKNIDANGKFIYVPHICFRGTKDEFKALSGHDNWVFGNKGNIITVHCTDGIMYY